MKSLAIVCFGAAAVCVQAATLYVSPTGSDGDGLTWETAKTSLQAGVDAAGADGLVLVASGAYATGGVIGAGGLRCRLLITNNVTVRSVFPHGAVIRGSGAAFQGDAANAVRCVEIASGALDGFVLEDGATCSSAYGDDSMGGGLFFHDMGSGTATNCIVRNCRAGGGGAAYNGILQGCVLTNNVAVGGDGGGALYRGKAYQCLIANNRALDGAGGGVYGFPNGEYADCTVCDNSATRGPSTNPNYGGGGAFYGTFTRCAISNNTATGFDGGGGGTCDSTLTDCVIARNLAVSSQGGGAFGGTLTRCLVSDNTVTNGSGGGTYGATLFQCRVLSNNLTSWHNGNCGGVMLGSAYNTLIACNRSHSVGGAFFADLYNCTVVGNVAISENTPGIHMAGTEKIYNCLAFGNTGSPEKPWLANCDIGNLGAGGDVKGTLAGTTDSAYVGIALVPAGTRVFTDFDHGDFSLWAGSPAFNAGDMTVPLQSVDLAGSARVLFGTVDAGAYEYNQLFVSPDGSDASDGRSWDSAKQTIQGAVDAAEASVVVWVTNGVYATGLAASPEGTVSNRVSITRAVRVKSVNGPAATAIRGAGAERFDTEGAVRCVFMNNGVLDGFTVEQGASRSGSGEYVRGGGGICIENAAVGTCVTNCVIRNNRAVTGGGVTGGMDNRGNATVVDCVITNNVGSYGGGGAYGAIFRRCLIAHNTAGETGGGCYEPLVIDNSLVAFNASTDCGGVYGPATLYNCTVADNTGGGVTGVDWGPGLHLYAYNCIVWGNSTWQWRTPSLTHFVACCCSEAGDGIAVTSDPLFADAANGDFRLKPASRCVDAGDNAWVAGLVDLSGEARVVDGTVDMGAYESPPFMRVTFDASPGTFVGLGTNRLDVYVPRTNLVYGSSLPTNAVFLSGRRFTGWYSQPEGAGTAVLAETPFVGADAHAVYAFWRRRGLILSLL